MLSMRALFGLVLGATVATGCTDAPASGDRGELLFNNNCTPCHGPDGLGQQPLAAPNIAGLPEWYVTSQLEKFKQGVRGAHFDDLPGMRMRPMSRTLETHDDLVLTASYVGRMARSNSAPTMTTGDADAGKAAYATCQACHGPDGMGNKVLNAPPIVDSDDWYMATQLHNFKHGIRGAHPDDATGATMAPMAKILADEQAIANVVAYIKTLSK